MNSAILFIFAFHVLLIPLYMVIRPVWHVVSKGVVRRLQATALQVDTPKTSVRLIQGWLPTGCRVVGHGRP
jgi:predicted NAD/FAD-binding protein